MENVLVVGANGTTGKKVVNLLKDSANYKPIAMVRKESQLEQFDNNGIETVLADLEKDVSHTGKNIDKIIFAAGSGGKKVTKVDQEGAKKMISVGEKAGLKKFVMLSAMGADSPNAVPSLKEYLEAKKRADEYLENSTLTYSIVRPGALTNEEGTGKIRAKKKIGESGNITRDDTAKTLVASLANDKARNTTFEILEGNDEIEEAIESV